MLAKEIAFQWANNKLLNDKKIVLLIFLRECNFNNIKSVENLVEHIVGSCKMTASLTEYFVQTEGKDLAIVFDGYDEISEEDRKNSIIARIIYRRIFGKSCLVITSRPTASSSLHGTVDCRVEIVGFTEEDRLDYIQTALQGNDDKVKTLTLYLQSNPTINALCYIPLNMTILLCLAEDGIENLPKTQTDMYKKFIEMTIVRYIQKVDTQVSKVITSIAELPHPHNKVFEELTTLAYKALKIDKIVFKLYEIKEVCPNLAVISSNWNGLGLLKAVQHFNTEIGNVTFHFLHFSIQEYMAALYISMLSHNKQIKLLNKTFWQHRYYNTWIMYVGITCGSSFALKHFLSGNWFQLTTRIFKTSDISKKFVENKIKCFHLFQCLVESNNEDVIASVSKFFQGNQIDLSNQTLLPSDVNTLGFFLVRSINKQWEMLNLSGCSIGSIGINILCDRFNKQSRETVVIKKVDLSYNQLYFSSLIQILDLLKSWHTSQLFIKGNEILQDHPSSDVYKAIEDAFFACNYNKPVRLKIGSFLFGLQTNTFSTVLLSGASIHSIYLINCSKVQNLSQNLNKVHLVNTPLSHELMTGLLKTGSITDLFVYNPELSDQDADEMILSSEKTKYNGIMLIISNSKIQGIIDTSILREQLTRLEILNLVKTINQKCSDHFKISPWKTDFCDNCSNDDLIGHAIIDLLQKINRSKWNWQLRIALIEKDELIAHKVNYEYISEKMTHQSLKAIYLNECTLKSEEYQIIFKTNATLAKLYICNSSIDQSCLTKFNLFLCKEIFIHSLCNINIEEISSCFIENCSSSIILVTKNEMLGCNPTTKQIALALQLEPSIDVLYLAHCQRNFDCFNQIITMLTITQNNWTKLDFMNCKVGQIEYEILQKHLRVNKQNHSTINTLQVSSKQLTELLVPKFIETVLMWKVQKIIFYDISHTVYECFAKKFTSINTSGLEPISVSVIYNSIENLYFLNHSWIQITRLLETIAADALYILNCGFPVQANMNVFKLCHISKLHIINSTLHDNTIVDIIETFVHRKLEISIYNISEHINDAALYNFSTSKKLLYQSSINFIAVAKNFMCGYNTTEDQLQQLQSQELSNLEHTIVTLVSNTKTMHERELFVFQNKQLIALHYVGKVSSAKFATELFSMLRRISTLKYFGIAKNTTITAKVANDLATALSHNCNGLEQLFLNSKLPTTHLLMIMEVLAKFTNLKVYEIDNITDQVTEYLMSIILHNAPLRYFGITNSNLCTSSFIKIAKVLQNTSNLQELTITVSSTGATTNIIAAVVSDNSKIQNLDLDDVNFQTICIFKTLSITNLQVRNKISSAEATENIAPTISFHLLLQELNISEKSLLIVPFTKAFQRSFIFKKLSINNITEEAADDIAAAFSFSTKLNVFYISGNYVRTLSRFKIAEALQQTSTLQQVYINNHITDETADDIVAAIYSNTQLKEFSFSKDNLQSTGATKIVKALQYISTLTKLSINDNHITDEAADDIAAAIYNNIEMQELNVSKNNLQSTGVIKIAKALQNISTLTKLNVSDNHVTDEAADDIAAAIYGNTQLKEFSFSKDNLQSTGAIKIVKALQYISTLTKLNISDNHITDEAADDIAAAIYNNIELQELNVSKNNLQSTGVIKIAKALQNISTLTKLNISDNHVTDEAADDIAAAIYNNIELQELNVSKNNLQSTGVIKIAKALQNISTLTKLNISDNHVTDEAADDIAAAIYNNIELQELNVSKNYLQSAGTIKILEALKNISTLTKLYINNNHITNKAAYDIAAVFPCNTQLQELDISNNCFQATGITAIASALQNIVTLTKLYIGNYSFTNEAAKSIAIVLRQNTELQEIDIGSNMNDVIIPITGVLCKNANLRVLRMKVSNNSEEAVESIAAAVASNIELQVLDISGLITVNTKFIKALQCISSLTNLCISNSKITDEAAGDLGVAISCNAQLQELDINSNNLKATGAIKIFKVLQGIVALRKLCISNNSITNKAADDIAATLSSNTRLQELDISCNFFQAAGTVIIMKALQGMLTRLYISNNNITEDAADDIAAAICSNTQLQEFDVGNNDLQSTGVINIARALQTISTLTKLYIHSNNINEDTADDIAAVICINTQLQEFDVGNNDLQSTGVINIAKALQTISTLTKLYIHSNNINEDAADDIAAVVCINTQLQEFDVGNNNLQSTGVIKIAKALQTISTLIKLCIHSNNINEDAADDIAAAISINTQLQEFDVGNNDLQSTGVIKIAKALQTISTLTKLYIHSNNINITEDAADDIAAVIYNNTRLQELDVGRNNLHSAGAIKIAKAMQSISTLTLYIHQQ